ncbi:MAG: putative transposase [Patiriisocius sp.]|jgi:putative transposase
MTHIDFGAMTPIRQEVSISLPPFPPDIISYAVWLYYRFNLSHRDIEDLLAQRGINVSRETIRLWCIKFGAIYTRRLKQKHRGYGDTFFIAKSL